MRVIAGKLGGRQFDAPRGHRTHPMSDKARGGLFNALGDMRGLTVLDAFAGSGALALESLSRGARHAVAIDIDKNAHQTIEENANALGLAGKLKAIRANASGWADNNSGAFFDVVFCDPPYDKPHAAVIKKLAKHVAKSGILVLSWPGREMPLEIEGMHVEVQKSYGDNQLIFYNHS